MKRRVILFVIVCQCLAASAQIDSVWVDSTLARRSSPVVQFCKDNNIFQHLDASVTLGTTGVGVEVSSPIGDYVRLRAGFAFMPHVHYKMDFGVQVGNDASQSDSKFERLAETLEDMTGYKVDKSVTMIGIPNYYNFKFLVDVFPFRQNRHWHVTAGFFLGSSEIAKAYNTTEDMTTLLAVGIYNNMYERVMNQDALFSLPGIGPVMDDPELLDKLKDKLEPYGRMGMPLGYYTHDIYDQDGNLVHKDGERYMMEPGSDGMVKAWAKTKAFKPYLGIGYGGRLLKGCDKYRVAVDCGAMFWGGKPSIVTHDGTDLANDVYGLRGKVGDYVHLFKGIKVFPVLDVRFTVNLF